MRLRLNAYVLAADPNFLAASVAAYLPLVDRIVISFDYNHVGWGGKPIAVDECLAQLEPLSASGKLDYRGGDFSSPAISPLHADTAQRQVALNQASDDADWVLQLDADEVMPNPQTFWNLVQAADNSGADALEYPSRWLYANIGKGKYLEQCSRWWGPASGYPGPLAVRAGTTLRLARQTDANTYRCDVRPRNTDPWHPKGARVDQVVSFADAVVHYSWVRSDEQMVAKSISSGHRDDEDWAQNLRAWRWRSRHPILTTLTTPLRGAHNHGWLRVVQVDQPSDDRR